MDNKTKIRKTEIRKTCFYALAAAAAMLLSYIETLIPLGTGIPGARIGLPNIVTLILLYTSGLRAAVLVSAARIILTGFMFGNMFSIAYSMSGFVLSLAVMLAARKSGLFSPLGVSIAGGVAHNMGQLAAAAFLAGPYVMSYFPALAAAGAIAGTVTGTAGGIMLRRITVALRELL